MHPEKLLCFLFISVSIGLFAQKKQVLLKDKIVIVDAKLSYTYEDSSGSVTDPFSSEFKKIEKQDLEINYNQDKEFYYWRKIVAINNSVSSTWMLEFPDPHIGRIKLFTLQKGKLVEFKETGFKLPFFNRPVEHKNYTFPLDIAVNDTSIIYARISSDGYCSMLANFRSIPNYVSYFFVEYHILGLYYGIILMLVFYNAFLAFYTRENVYLYYCLYTVSCALFTYSEDGLAFEFLWPSHPFFNYLLERLARVLLLVSFLFYSGNLIDLGRRERKLQIAILVFSFIFLVYHLFVTDRYHLGNVVYIMPFVVTFYSAIKIFRGGYMPARFFLIGNSIILISFVVFFLRANGWIVSNAFTVYLFNYGFVFEAIVFSIALADKLKMTKDEKDKAQREIIRQLEINEVLQQKVNTELENKVEERTVQLKNRSLELLEANEKLEKLKIELYEMNSKMDINIWELKKEVKREMEARFLNDTIPYNEFIEIYTDVKCYQYLKELKWKDGFVCPKCGNTKSGRGNNNFTFKCTQCQHQESVTSHTLFHGVKFPISKAFYLAYYIMKNGNDVTYEELSQVVGVTKNTVWKFGRKVNSGLKLITNKKNMSLSWEKLVLTTPEDQ